MAYAVCIRARLIEAERWRDKSMTGVLKISGTNYRFKTRSHLTKAINSQYSEISWKPSPGDELIFDGEIFKDQAIIDHVELWRPQDFFPLGRHVEFAKRIHNQIPSLPSMSKLLRHSLHDDEGFEIRFVRWMKRVDYIDGRKKIPAILSAICADNEIRFCAKTKSEGKMCDLDKVILLPIIAETLQIPRAEIQADEPLGVPEKAVKTSSNNPNKWIPGQPYRPIGMPEVDPFDENAPALESYSDIPF